MNTPATASATPTRWASVYANDRLVCLQTCSAYVQCAHDPAGKSVFISFQQGAAALGAGLREALAASRLLKAGEAGEFFRPENLQRRYATWVATMQTQFGVSSREALFGGMRHCVVTQAGDAIRLRPTHYASPENWNADGIAASQTVVVSEQDSAEAWGQAVQLALGRCT